MSFSLLPFLVILFLVKRVTQSLQNTPYQERWRKPFLGLRVLAWGLLFLDVFSSESVAVRWLWDVLLLGVVLLMLRKEEFRSSKTLAWTVLPFVAIDLLRSIVRLAAPHLYQEWEDYFSVSVVFAFISIFVLWFSQRKQQKALEAERLNALMKEAESKAVAERKMQLELEVAERTAELLNQKNQLEEMVVKLKETQNQLVQQEKLASLGELTAGIAHEIQNPLNFVNNFSEVSAELLTELIEGPIAALPEQEKEYAQEILNDLTLNLQKINFHGKRADGIVKGMLMHSRASSGKKELADINALADEYLRLSYHGLRATNKTFNATMITNFDKELGLIEIIPQDIGRVLLNLFNNAFYSIAEKKNLRGEDFQPTVWVTSKKTDPDERGRVHVELTIRDNGMGIPQGVIAKIYQPFFTTKPAGKGTGLGLSISYEIITKGHNGELSIRSEEGEFAEFTLLIPLS